MPNGMRVRARKKGDATDVRVLIRHDMETGRRRNEDGEVVAAHYIQNVTVWHGERVVLFAQWGPAVSKNPYFVFKFRDGVAGDRVHVTWVDNKGQSGTGETLIT
jgi:sulfur-oxidizing protein SoxZ